jgi:hypothetical protein
MGASGGVEASGVVDGAVLSEGEIVEDASGADGVVVVGEELAGGIVTGLPTRGAGAALLANDWPEAASVVTGAVLVSGAISVCGEVSAG